ncbi:MAG: TniQ family protein [Methylobacter sp.]
MLIPHTDYPVRLLIEKGESLAGYIFRFYSANGHRVPSAVHNAILGVYDGIHKKAETAFDIVQSIVGDSATFDRSWWLNRSLIDRHPDRLKRTVWRRINFDPVRFCPACLGELGFHFALWELPLMQTCLLHKCVLLTKCSQCQKKLAWSEISPDWRCRCGESITEMSAKPATKSALAIAQFLAESSGDIELPDNIQKYIRELPEEMDCQCGIHISLDWGEFQDIIFEERSKFWHFVDFEPYLYPLILYYIRCMLSGNEL